MPSHVIFRAGIYYYRPGALGRKAGEPITLFRLGKDMEAAALRAESITACLKSGLRYSEPVEVTRAKLQSLVHRTKERAKLMKRPHDLTLDYLEEILRKQHQRCAVTGLPFSQTKHGNRVGPWSVSVDRIDCSGGYTKGNVRLVCHAANVALNEWGDGVLLTLAEAIGKRAPRIGPSLKRASDVSP